LKICSFVRRDQDDPFAIHQAKLPVSNLQTLHDLNVQLVMERSCPAQFLATERGEG
jgi:hypothetical protein